MQNVVNEQSVLVIQHVFQNIFLVAAFRGHRMKVGWQSCSQDRFVFSISKLQLRWHFTMAGRPFHRSYQMQDFMSGLLHVYPKNCMLVMPDSFAHFTLALCMLKQQSSTNSAKKNFLKKQILLRLLTFF